MLAGIASIIPSERTCPLYNVSLHDGLYKYLVKIGSDNLLHDRFMRGLIQNLLEDFLIALGCVRAVWTHPLYPSGNNFPWFRLYRSISWLENARCGESDFSVSASAVVVVFITMRVSSSPNPGPSIKP